MSKTDQMREYFARKKARGLCYCCTRPATHGIRCDRHHEQMARRRQARQAERRSQQRCPCGGPLEPRRRLCTACRVSRQAQRTVDHQLDTAAKRRAAYALAKRKGVCVRCKEIRPRQGKTLCPACADILAVYQGRSACPAAGDPLR